MRSTFPKIVFAYFVMALAGLTVFGQQSTESGPSDPEQEAVRPNLVKQLGLSREQVRRFRDNNLAHRPLMQAAQQRLREANRELDLAIYSDTTSDSAFNAKLASFQDAQREVTRLRFTNELAIRKMLTPAQLVRFREMRNRFNDRANKTEDRRPSDQQQRPIVRALRNNRLPVR